MKFKPPVIPQNEVAEQTHALSQQKDQLKTQLQVISHRVHMIEVSLQENETLKKQIQDLLHQSQDLFQLEWNRRIDHYPDIRAAIIQKATELVAPPPKKA